MRPILQFRHRRIVNAPLWILMLVAVGCFSRPLFAANKASLQPVLLMELEAAFAQQSSQVRPGRLAGRVRAVVPEAHLVALQDASGTVLLELPALDAALTNGQRLAIAANPGFMSRTDFGIRIEDVPVVDHDGLHSEISKSGQVFLERGLNPIRLTWFNGPAEFALKLEYEGPELARRPVPNHVLWWAGTNGTGLLPGVRFHAYQKERYPTISWENLPGFERLLPRVTGVATNFSVDYRVKDQNCGLAFDGFLQIDRAGDYTFHLTSDDGSRLYVGPASVDYELTGPAAAPDLSGDVVDWLPNGAASGQWVRLEGEVTFVAESQFGLELELNASGRRLAVQVIDRGQLASAQLLRRTIRIEGIAKTLAGAGHTLVIVPGEAQVQVEELSAGRENNQAEKLTTAMQVQRLSPGDAERHLPAKITGVVTYVGGPSIVLNDFSGGVFITARSWRWERQPELGELWEIEGTTDPGFFSPVVSVDKAAFLGHAPMPEPVHPVWDQLMNGNLDAQYGELRGVVTAVSEAEIVLLLPEGRVSVVGSEERPVPEFPESLVAAGRLVGSVVRIRGCFATVVDVQSRRVIPGKILIYPAKVEVEEPRPSDPFLLSRKTVQDLKWFDARGTVLQRTKLAGQIIFVTAREVFVEAEGAGFRIFANQLPPVNVGDWIEAVGFPKLGGASPVLQEAEIRVTRNDPLARPAVIEGDQLMDRALDSTLVAVQANLIRDTLDRGERVLELQSGPFHFAARLKADTRDNQAILPGSELQLTGVYVWADETRGRLAANVTPFEILLPGPESVVVLRHPSWWTIRRAISVAAALAGLLCVASVWVIMLRRQVQQRTAQLKIEIEERQLAEQRRAIEQERIRMARDLHDELGAGLTEVGMLGALANTESVATEVRHRYLGQLTKVAHTLVSALDEIVWAVNPDYDTVSSLVSYFSLYAESFLSLAGIKCRLQVMDSIPDEALDSRLRHGLLCAFKEALNNVVRHAQATEVQIRFETAEGNLVVAVADNGRGFARVPDASGKDGLRGLKERLQSLGGDCDIVSAADRGTTVTMRLPLTQHQNGQSSHR